MTGPEHYLAAERCINATIQHDADVTALLAEAQVHATLALVAATAVVADDETAWRLAIEAGTNG